MKIATLYRKDGKVILETDNDAIAQVATDSPQDVVVMDAYERMAARYLTDARQVGRPLALAAPYGLQTERRFAGEAPAHADRIDAAIQGRAMAEHQLWAKGDPGLPDVLTDRNGDVVLGMCRVCGQAEGELTGACPIVPAHRWPDGAGALVWSAVGLGKWVTVDSSTGTWEVELADVPMPEGWDWRVPVTRQPATDLEQFRRFIHACGYGAGAYPERKSEADRLLALIDGQADPLCVKKLADCQYPKCGCNDRPTLCDLCQVREEVCSDAEGVPFCQERWDGWQAVQP